MTKFNLRQSDDREKIVNIVKNYKIKNLNY
jgi:hypothetical protein